MRVKALDHVNIFTEDLAGTVKFYTEMFDLSVRDGPVPLRPDQVQWICDAENRPILHINTTGAPQAFKRDARPGPTTGAVHHVALNCVGAPDLLARLDARKLTYAVNDIASIGLKQIFVHDPNGVLLELNFFAS